MIFSDMVSCDDFAAARFTAPGNVRRGNCRYTKGLRGGEPIATDPGGRSCNRPGDSVVQPFRETFDASGSRNACRPSHADRNRGRGADPLRPAKKNVSIKDMQFQPAAIEVQAGDTVTWTNNDDRDHTVTADDGSFKSDNISTGGKFVYKFTNAANSVTRAPIIQG
jgi:plastocyanin